MQQLVADQGKEAAEILSNLSQATGPAQGGSNQHVILPSSASANSNIHPDLQGPEPGPNSHPHGPPSLGMTSEPGPNSHPHGPPTLGMNPNPPGAPPIPQEGSASASLQPAASPSDKPSAGRRRTGPPTVNGLVMGSEEWARQRKDNHKEVERRRRGNINEGINELARIVPNGTGEKAKGAILSRAVQYIHHLKDNEARNIEKWTLEKLLMDQAMGDLQAQLEEIRRAWESERRLKETAEAELEQLRKELAKYKGSAEVSSGKKRASPDTEAQEEEDEVEKNVDEDDRGVKRKKISA